MIHDEQIQKQVLFFVTLLPHLCLFYRDVAALQYGRRSHFRAQGLGRPSSKFLCFGFASTNHVARNHIDRNVYGSHCLH